MNRSGVALLEVLVALAILGTAGLALVTLESAALVPVPSSNFHHTTVVFDEGFIWHVAQGRRLPPRM